MAWTPDLGDLPVAARGSRGCSPRRGPGWRPPGVRCTTPHPGCRTRTRSSTYCGPPGWPGMAPLLRAHRDQLKATVAGNIDRGIALTGDQIAAARLAQAAIFARFAAFLRDGRYEVLAAAHRSGAPVRRGDRMGARDQRGADGRLHRLAAVLLPDHGHRPPGRLRPGRAGRHRPARSWPRGAPPGSGPRCGRPACCGPAGRPAAGRPLRRRPPPAGNSRRGHVLGLRKPPGRETPRCCRARRRRAPRSPAWPARRTCADAFR